jgi:hypothetical protein
MGKLHPRKKRKRPLKSVLRHALEEIRCRDHSPLAAPIHQLLQDADLGQILQSSFLSLYK